MKKICIITGSRAEYGLLRTLICKIKEDPDLSLQLVVTGMHLSYEFGLTYRQIEEEGYAIDAKVEVNLSSDTSIAVCKAMGLGMISLCETYERLKPDMLVVLGDRYEIFSAVVAAYISRIPVAHIHGGETTEGAFDDGIRHSISKMSYLHFTSTQEYCKRVIQLGESPKRVYNVGALGVEQIKKIKLLTVKQLEENLNVKLKKPLALVTFHPETLQDSNTLREFEKLLMALHSFEELQVIFTKANSDTNGREINRMIERYVASHKEKTAVFTTLGSKRYLSLMNYSSVLIGNSSSGIIEAPSLQVPTINIGDRQKGRAQATSIMNVDASVEALQEAIRQAISTSLKWENIINPYEKENTSDRIVTIIKKTLGEPIILKKSFYDVKWGEDYVQK